MINRLEREFILKRVVLYMMGNGRMIFSVVMGQKYGKIICLKKIIIKKIKGQTVHIIRENFLRVSSKDMVVINGLMDLHILVHGSIIRDMDKALNAGRMVKLT